MRVERSLRLERGRGELLVGESVVVRVSDETNRPIEGAVVEAGSERTRTDDRGRCEITFRTPGFRKIVAAKAPSDRIQYEPASTLVRVLPRTTTARSARHTGFRSV